MSLYQPYSTTGFYKAPISKALIVLSSALSSLLLVLGPRYQNYFIYSNDYLLNGQELWRLVTCKLAFLEVHSLLLGASLLYHFRILERRYGSAKFTSFLLANLLLCCAVEVGIIFGTQALEYDILPQTLCGPQSLVFSLFVPFFLDVPNVSAQPNVISGMVAGKWISYVLGIYLTTLTHTTPFVIAYGILAGIIYRLNVLFIRSWLRVPQFLAAVCDNTLGWLLSSRPPSEGVIAMGATLELQRQQRMEFLEQRMLLAQAQQFRGIQRQNAIRRPVRQAFPVRRRTAGDVSGPIGAPTPGATPNGGGVRSASVNGFAPFMRASPSSSPPPPPQPQPPPDAAAPDPGETPSTSTGSVDTGVSGVPEDRQIQQLVDMGFNRAAVMQALRMSRNDVTKATTVLLQE